MRHKGLAVIVLITVFFGEALNQSILGLVFLFGAFLFLSLRYGTDVWKEPAE